MRRVSAKRAAENELRRDAIMAVNLRSRGWCETCPIIVAGGYPPPHRGDHRSNDGHEPQMRSRGGPITDPDLILGACRESHDWIHAHPIEATALGLLRV